MSNFRHQANVNADQALEEGTATAVLQVSEVSRNVSLAPATSTGQSWTLKTVKKVAIARYV